MKQERNAYDDVIKPDSEPVINVSNGVDFGASGTGHRRTIAGSWRILAILGVLAGLISLFSRDEPESRGETASEDVRKPPAAVTLADTVSRKPKEQDNKRTFRLFSRSVATLEAKDRSGSTISQGSGFLINREGLLVTNLHVIPMSSASVYVTFSDERERIAEGVVAISEEDDLAVLKVPKRLLPMPCRIADTGGDVEVGDSICVIGSPVGLSNSLSEGSVSSFRGDEGNVLQISAPISPGSSGSPVFSSKGEVIAVATASVEGAREWEVLRPVSLCLACLSDCVIERSSPWIVQCSDRSVRLVSFLNFLYSSVSFRSPFTWSGQTCSVRLLILCV